jgi:hypothetical protein
MIGSERKPGSAGFVGTNNTGGLLVLDKNKVPINTVEDIDKRMLKVKRILEKKFE